MRQFTEVAPEDFSAMTVFSGTFRLIVGKPGAHARALDRIKLVRGRIEGVRVGAYLA